MVTRLAPRHWSIDAPRVGNSGLHPHRLVWSGVHHCRDNRVPAGRDALSGQDRRQFKMIEHGLGLDVAIVVSIINGLVLVLNTVLTAQLRRPKCDCK